MFLIALQLTNYIHILEIHLCLSIFSSVYLELDVLFKK